MFIPKNVSYIIDNLYNNDFEGFMVGGCIRDSLLGRIPKDFDIATNALPKNIIDIFEKTIPTGIKHGTITVLINSIPYEVTTYRIDGEYKNNRSPEQVIFVNDIQKDLSRRDFTINAMAYNNKYKLIDCFKGREDLKNQIIRTVGNSDLRFKEDALRMLRAIRFATQLNFNIEKETFKSIKRNKYLIQNISTERIREEFCKILLSSKPSRGLILLNKSGLLSIILPEIQNLVEFNQKTPCHNKDIFMHTLDVVDNIENTLILKLSALFHDVGKPKFFRLDQKGIGHFYGYSNESENLAINTLKRLKFDNNTIKSVSILVKEHMNILVNPKDSTIKKLINRVSKDLIFDLYKLQKADIKSTAPPFLFLNNVDYLEHKTKEFFETKEPITLKDLNIDGNDLLKKLNIKPGKTVGIILNKLLDIILENPALNNKDSLLKLSKEILDIL